MSSVSGTNGKSRECCCVCGWCMSLKCEIHHTRSIEVPNKEQSVQVDKETRTFSLFFCMKVGCSKKKKREQETNPQIQER